MFTKPIKSLLVVSLALVISACSSFAPRAPSLPSEAEIEKEEQAVYAFFLKEFHTTLVLKNTSTSALYGDTQQTINSIKPSLKDTSQETLSNFVERNQEENQLSPDMDLGIDYEILSQEELAKISRQPNWQELLKKKSSDSSGYLIFSRVGFNSTLDEALVYVGRVEGPLMGSGSYYVMEKKDAQWTIKQEIMIWIS